MDKKFVVVAAGSVLASLLVIVSLNVFVNMFYPSSPVPGGAEKHTVSNPASAPEAPKSPAVETPPTTPAPVSTPAEPTKPLPERLAAANADAGVSETKKCTACHTFEKVGPNKVGPNLYGMVGRPVGKQDNFNYSDAMKNHGGNWDFQLLDCYLKDPKACIPGNKMVFPGIKNDADRANAILFLRSLADSPAPLPQP